MSKQEITHKIQLPGLISLLTVAFVVLKLLGVISWSWVWVLAPLWISTGIGLLILLVILLLAVFS